MKAWRHSKSLIRIQSRNFLQNFKEEGVNKEEVISRIDSNTRTYTHNSPLIFDPLGRYLLYDNIIFALKSKPRTISTVIWMGSTYMAYLSYYAAPFVASTFYGYSTVAGLSTLFNLGRFFDRRNGISRFYLLDNLQMVRIENGNGVSQDIPISGVNIINEEGSGPMINLNVNGKKLTLKLMKDTFLEPELLYACLSPQVFSIVGSQ